MAKWRESFQKQVTEIERDPRLEVTEVEFGDPASASVMAKAEAAAGRLPEGMRDFYGEMNGFTLKWQGKSSFDFGFDRVPTGSIKLLPIISDGPEGVFNSWDKVVWFSDQGDERFKKVKPFDFFVEEACAALYPTPGNMLVHYHYFGEELHPTGYTFGRYLELLLRSRGFWYWPTSLCVDLQESVEVERFRTQMPVLFRDHDDSLFVPATTDGEIRTS
jgi:hypothetical protein